MLHGRCSQRGGGGGVQLVSQSVHSRKHWMWLIWTAVPTTNWHFLSAIRTNAKLQNYLHRSSVPSTGGGGGGVTAISPTTGGAALHWTALSITWWMDGQKDRETMDRMEPHLNVMGSFSGQQWNLLQSNEICMQQHAPVICINRECSSSLARMGESIPEGRLAIRSSEGTACKWGATNEAIEQREPSAAGWCGRHAWDWSSTHRPSSALSPTHSIRSSTSSPWWYTIEVIVSSYKINIYTPLFILPVSTRSFISDFSSI